MIEEYDVSKGPVWVFKQYLMIQIEEAEALLNYLEKVVP